MNPGAPDTRLYRPNPVRVDDEDGRPARVEGRAVEAVREDWLVEDRWWTPHPIRRRYFELVLAGGRCIVVYRDLITRQWYEQRA